MANPVKVKVKSGNRFAAAAAVISVVMYFPVYTHVLSTLQSIHVIHQ